MVKKLQKKAKKPKIVTVEDDYRPVPPPITYKPIPAPSTNETIKKPVPKPSKSVKQIVSEYEDLILPPPPQFRDGYKPVPAPRTNETIKKPMPKQCKIVKQIINEYEHLILPPPPQFRDGYKPVPAPRTDKSQKQLRHLPPGSPKIGHFISRRQSELIVQENQEAQKPIRRPPQRPPPSPLPPQQTKYDYPFNLTMTYSKLKTNPLENSKSLAHAVFKMRNSKVSRMNSKLKSLKNWMTLKRFITYSKN